MCDGPRFYCIVPFIWKINNNSVFCSHFLPQPSLDSLSQSTPSSSFGTYATFLYSEHDKLLTSNRIDHIMYLLECTYTNLKFIVLFATCMVSFILSVCETVLRKCVLCAAISSSSVIKLPASMNALISFISTQFIFRWKGATSSFLFLFMRH